MNYCNDVRKTKVNKLWVRLKVSQQNVTWISNVKLFNITILRGIKLKKKLVVKICSQLPFNTDDCQLTFGLFESFSWRLERICRSIATIHSSRSCTHTIQNKCPLNKKAHQLGEMVIYLQTMVELFDSMLAELVLACTCMQYSITFCTLLEVASDVSTFVTQIVSEIGVKFGYCGWHCSIDIQQKSPEVVFLTLLTPKLQYQS